MGGYEVENHLNKQNDYFNKSGVTDVLNVLTDFLVFSLIHSSEVNLAKCDF